MAYRGPQTHARILDRGTPLARGLSFYIPGNEGSGAALEYTQKKAITTASGVGWLNTELGPLLNLCIASATTEHVTRAETSPGATSPLSVACWYEPNEVTTAAQGFLSWAGSYNSGSPHFIFQNNSGNLRIYWANGYRVDLSGVLATGQPTHIALSFTGAIATFYVNGQSRGNYTASATNTGAATFYIGAGFQNPRNARIGDVGVWTRALSAAEVFELYATPFRLLARRARFFLAAAAPGGFRPQGPLGHPFHGAFGGPV